MSGMEYSTLKCLLEAQEVCIPQLQRDYAQGRDGEREIRESFVGKLYNTLAEGKHINLDFIYGYSKAGIFYPIDGQQRLTTLWLLHWFLVPSNESPQWLARFSYRTRETARRFCEHLVDHRGALQRQVEAPQQTRPTMVSAITDSAWFRQSWRHEPTVAGMLAMLEAIEAKFPNDAQRAEFWARLTASPDTAAITFNVIELRSEEFRLTDELYIKMNARGKPLSPFEHYKARLIEALEGLGAKRKYKDTTVSYAEYFGLRSDNEWMDLFWEPAETESGSKGGIAEDRMLNFYTTIARLCFFREALPSGKSTRPIEEFTKSNESRYKVFESKEHADFLFDTMNIFYAVKQNGGIESFFAQLTQHLSLFGYSNLFKEACEGTPDVRCEVLLLFLVEYMRRYKITKCSEQLCDFIRIVRNLLSTIRQVDELRYTSDVRINVLHRYWEKWSPLLDAYPPYAQLARPNGSAICPDEGEKARLIYAHPELKCTIQKLEEHPLLRGLIHIFEPEKYLDKLTQWAEDFYSIWALVDTTEEALITQALIACDYRGSYIQDVWYGQKGAWFFGRGERWHTLLTNDGSDADSWKESLREPLQTLLDRYAAAKGTKAHKKLQGIVESYVATQVKVRGWEYYFCKYPSMLAEQPYYAWANDDEFAIRRMGSYSRHPLSAYHCNPYAYAVSQLVGGDAQLGWGRHSDCPPDLTVASTLTLTCQKDGWLVKWCDGVSLSPAIERVLGQYGVDKPDGVLRDTPDQDRVQRAVAFCRSLRALQ